MDIKTEFYLLGSDGDQELSFSLKVETAFMDYEICVDRIDKKKFRKWRKVIDVLENGGQIEELQVTNGENLAYLSCNDDELIINCADDILVNVKFILDNVKFNLNKCRDELVRALKEIFDDSSLWRFYE